MLISDIFTNNIDEAKMVYGKKGREVVRKYRHPFYGKVIRRSKKYHAHDEKNKFKEGEIVSIIETKPISKLKRWQVIEKWYKSKQNY